MKIAILTSGILPVPAVKGGAVETLTDFYLEYNNKYHLHDITVYSISDKDTINHPAIKSKVNHYYFIDTKSIFAKIHKRIYHLFHKNEEYYHYTIEFYLYKAIKHLRKKQYDIILIENRPGYALKLKQITKTPLIYHLHNEKLTKEINCYQEIYEAATRIITVSNYIKSRVQTINTNDLKCITVYNGIDLNAFSTLTKTMERSEIGFKKDDFIMVFSGRITPEKGIEQLIDAMLLLQDIKQIKLLVIGNSFYGNTNNTDSYSHKLKLKAKSLADRIVFTGYISYNLIPSYLKIADIAVIPSIWNDPFPTTILEAQAMGLPIITTPLGGIPEETNTKNSIMIPNNEEFIENLANSIRRLYTHPEERAKMSIAALERSKYFNKERYARDFFNAIHSLNFTQ